MMTLNLPVNARKIAISLAVIAVCLGCFSVIGRLVLEQMPEADETSLTYNIVQMFNINRENSIPAWFTASLLLVSSAVLAVIAAAKRAAQQPYTRHWTALAVIFLYLSIDEAASIHESFTQPLQVATGSTGHLYFAWLLVGIPLVLIVALVYLPFLLHLPPAVRNKIALAGGLYVGGAVGIELIGSNLWYQADGSTVLYSIVGTVEEVCEMWGVILLLYTLLTCIEDIQVTVNQQSQAKRDSKQAAVPDAPVSPRAAALVVFLSGVNLMLVQWLMVRELSALLLATELIVLLMSIAYFAGISLGYFIAPHIRRNWLMPLAVVTLLMHLTLPVWLRLLVVALADNGVYPLIFVVLPVLTIPVIPAFYSMFLPYLVQNSTASEPGSRLSGLPFLYAVELLGAVGGIGVLVTAGGMGVQTVLLIYAPVLLVMVHLIQPRLRYYAPVMIVLGLLSAAWIALFPAANAWSNTLWYERVKGLPAGTETLFTAYSPYQKVDMMEAPDGRRYMFLDGLEHFGSDSTLWLSVIMGRIPAQLIQPEKSLAVGAGGMNTARMMAEYGNSAVTTVEIDPVVVDASLNFLSDSNGMDTLRNRTIVIDDAKHFLANTPEKYDMVAADTPAAISLQTAALYSVPFYELIEARLNPGGVLSANLTDIFEPDNPDTPEAEGLVARRIAASLLVVYDDVLIVTSSRAGWSFAYAADDLPFSAADVEMALSGAGEREFVLFDVPAVKAITGDAIPITLDTMDIVLQTGADWLKDRLTWR